MPLEGKSLAEAAQSYSHSPSRFRAWVSARRGEDGGIGRRAACCFRYLPEGEEAASDCIRGSTIRTGCIVAILGGSVEPEELTDEAIPLDDLIWRLFHEEEELRTLPAIRLSRGCRCDPDYVRSVIARFPADEREAMVGEDGVIRVDCAFCSS